MFYLVTGRPAASTVNALTCGVFPKGRASEPHLKKEAMIVRSRSG
jgi:hypothetical protein